MFVSARTFDGNSLVTVSDAASFRDGSTILAGTTKSTDLPTVNASKATNPARECFVNDGISIGQCGDGFLIKLTRDGQLDFMTYFGDVQDDSIRSVLLDDAEHIFLFGKSW